MSERSERIIERSERIIERSERIIERSERIMVTAPKAHGCTSSAALMSRCDGTKVHQ